MAPTLIAGSGHLGDRLEWLLRTSHAVARVEPVPPGPLATFERALERASIATAASIYILVEKLRAEAYPLLVVEKDANNRFLPAIRGRGIPVMIADATVPGTLADAAVDRASAVVSVMSDDLLNLEVGLNARAIQPRIRVVLRVFDRDTADELRARINIHYAISTSAIAARAMLERADREAGNKKPAGTV